MHHFRMKSFSLIPSNKKDVLNFWCCCCRFTDGSQQNLFIGSCSVSRGKRRSTSRLYLVNFYKFYGEIGVISLFFNMKIFTMYIPIIFLQSNDSRYDCMWMSSSESGGEPKLICIPKLQLLDVIRMTS